MEVRISATAMKILQYFLLFTFCSSIFLTNANFLLTKTIKSPKHHFYLAKAVFKIMEDFYQFKGSISSIVRSTAMQNRQCVNDVINEVLSDLRLLDLTTEIEDFEVLKVIPNRKRYSVIIYIDRVETFLKQFRNLSSDRFKFRRYFTVVATMPLSLEDIQMVFDAFWKVYIKNVNLINQDDSSTIHLYTFMPFTKGNCSDIRPVKINIFDNGLLAWQQKIFHPSDKVKNLQNCTLVLGVAIGTGEPYAMAKNDSKGNQRIRGIEKDLFTEFARAFNFYTKYRVIGTFPGLLFENGTATGIARKLKRKFGNFSLFRLDKSSY